MTEATKKRLLKALSGIEALRREAGRGSLDEAGGVVLQQCIAEFASVGGATALEVFMAWRDSGSPARDPRPPLWTSVREPGQRSVQSF